MSNAVVDGRFLRVLRTPATLLALVGWLVTGAALVLFDPVFGIVTLLVALPLWIGGLRSGAFALTQVGVATIAASGPPVTIATLEAGPIVLAIALLAEADLTLRASVIALAIGGGLLGVVIAALAVWASVTAAGIALVITAALTSYLVHRYELLTLGLVA